MTLSVTRSDLVTYIRDNYYSKLDTVAERAVVRAVENGLRRASRDHEWAFLHSTIALNAVAPYSTGTVSINHASTSVTGSGTTFPSTVVGQYIEFNGEGAWYEITVRGGDTSLTLRNAYSNLDSGNLSGATYVIVNPLIDLPANFRRHMDLIDQGRREPLGYVKENPLWYLHAARAGTGTPQAYSIHTKKHDPNQKQILLYPAPNAVENYELLYIREAGWFSSATPATSTWKLRATADTDYVDWPEAKLDVLYAAILLKLWEEVDPGKAGSAMGQYLERLSDAKADDQENAQIRTLSDGRSSNPVFDRYRIEP